MGLKVKDYEPKTLTFESIYNNLYLEQQPNGYFRLNSKEGYLYPRPLTPESALAYIQEVKARDIKIYKRIPKNCTAYTLKDMVYVYKQGNIIDSIYLPFKNQLY
jgi:hypothetical protein